MASNYNDGSFSLAVQKELYSLGNVGLGNAVNLGYGLGEGDRHLSGNYSTNGATLIHQDDSINALVNRWLTGNRVQTTPDQAGNTLGTALRTGLLDNQTKVFNDSIGGDDLNDYYRFRINSEQAVTISLTGLTNDADIQLIRDINDNGALDAGEVIAYSNRAGAQDDSISTSLASGRYFVRVLPYSGSTDYTLTLTAAGIPDLAGDTLATARNLNTLSDTQTFTDFVGGSDQNDFYSFSLSSLSTVDIALNDLSADADLQLIQDQNNNGIVDYGEIIAYSDNWGSDAETLTPLLEAGTYFIRVFPYYGSTTYTLSASATAVTLPTNYSMESGYGLVNAGSAVAQAIGQTTFADGTRLGGNSWDVDAVNAPDAWAQGYTGQNVVVAVIDTGVDYTHTDLDGNIWVNSDEIAGNGIDDDNNGYVDDTQGWDFVQDDNTPTDGYGHGTHVAGTIAAENDGTGSVGVAYDAQIMSVRVLGDDGSGTYADVAAGIRYAADNGADVINLSLGGGFSQEMVDAIAYANQQGSFVVMAAGNEYGSQPSFPADLAAQYGIAVGAVDINNQMPGFSNQAGFPITNYVVAPGYNIYSTVPGNQYDTYSGTSMATPHVAGVVALMLSANPNLTTAEIQTILTQSATSLASDTATQGTTQSFSEAPSSLGAEPLIAECSVPSFESVQFPTKSVSRVSPAMAIAPSHKANAAVKVVLDGLTGLVSGIPADALMA